MIKNPVTFITIDAEYCDQRIDNFLFTHLKTIPKTHIYRILRKGEIRVNKKRIKPHYRLQTHDLIRLPPLEIGSKPDANVPGERIQQVLMDRILYEDDNLLIINKPAGIPVHSGSASSVGVIEIARAMYPKLKHLELAHRLDLHTSGCLIIAKKRSILKEVNELLRDGKVHKVYLALTKGFWNKHELKVDLSLRKNHLASGERIVTVDKTGKKSLTVFKMLKNFTHCSLVEATLHTGRTHQIRVHAAAKGHPLAYDTKYGDKEFDKTLKLGKLNRLFLHSHLLEFTLPGKEPIKVVAPLDKDLQTCLNKLISAHDEKKSII